MIFTSEDAKRITAGKKVQHRIPAVDTDHCRFRVGRDYAVETIKDRPESELYGFTSTIAATGKTRRRRGKHAQTVARITITEATLSTLGKMTVVEARAEGHRTTTDYQAAWCQRHGLEQHDPDQPVWVLTFKTVRERDDRIRLLHKESSRGYTQERREALPDEPEAVDAITQRQFTADAQTKVKVTQIQVWADHRAVLEAEITKLEESDLGRSVGSTIRALRRQVQRLDEKITQRAA